MLKKYELIEIEDIHEEGFYGDVYDLTVEDNHSYCVNENYIVHNCADASHGVGGHIIADGGCRTPGDVAKAFGAGADFVMLGGMLAGHDQSSGKFVNKIEQVGWKIHNGYGVQDLAAKQYMEFYGMSSKKANDKYSGGLEDYRSSEGRETLIPYKGDVSDTIDNILGGLRSACTYVGATKLKELTKRTTFVKVNNIYNTVFEKYST